MPDAAAPTLDLLIGRSLLTAESIAAELRERLAAVLAGRRFAPEPELLELAHSILADFEPILAENLLAADLAAWIAGYDQLASRLPEWALETVGGRWGGPPPPPRLPSLIPGAGDSPDIRFPLIEEAAASLWQRGVLTRDEFDRQHDAAKARSFTIAGDLTQDTIETIRDALAEDVREGTSLHSFRARVIDALDGSPIGPAHLENVYRTNVQAAFRDGRETLAAHPIVSEVFPYQAYHAVHDGRVRLEHLALESLGIDGTNVYRRDDPFWDRFTPPNGYNCRCGVTLVTIDGAARAGVREAQEWLRTGNKPPLEPRRIPFENEPGFGQRSGRQAVAMSLTSSCVCCGYVVWMGQGTTWDEDDHPRGDDGKFTDADSTDSEDGEWEPEHQPVIDAADKASATVNKALKISTEGETFHSFDPEAWLKKSYAERIAHIHERAEEYAKNWLDEEGWHREIRRVMADPAHHSALIDGYLSDEYGRKNEGEALFGVDRPPKAAVAIVDEHLAQHYANTPSEVKELFAELHDWAAMDKAEGIEETATLVRRCQSLAESGDFAGMVQLLRKDALRSGSGWQGDGAFGDDTYDAVSESYHSPKFVDYLRQGIAARTEKTGKLPPRLREFMSETSREKSNPLHRLVVQQTQQRFRRVFEQAARETGLISGDMDAYR